MSCSYMGNRRLESAIKREIPSLFYDLRQNAWYMSKEDDSPIARKALKIYLDGAPLFINQGLFDEPIKVIWET